ncbi:hypothetical protein JOD02_001298 [Caldicoprobacter guelmensis]|uniref:YwmB family TATA-box binding protein n=1 Tax=Caldicoprobacter guelmensis TaxID=1170224 RepID=UPI0019560917|nr:YwmB family TATA-box binding protein [Caldicoprobacter guelmensis]MBM7582441.1 hypothetical protein [Caldicoprobacter guelmensis]
MGYKNVLVVLTALVLSIIFSFQSRAIQEPVLVESIMMSLGCTIEYLDINGWCPLKGGPKSLLELRLLAEEAAEFFGVVGDFDVFTSQSQSITQVNITGVNDRQQVVSIIICQSKGVLNRDLGDFESYIVVNVIDHSQNVDGSLFKRRVHDFLQEVGERPTVTVTYVGSFEGRLEFTKMQNICDTMLKNLRGTAVEGIHDEGFVSISGYSMLLGKGIISGGKQVNIQVAMRYNSYKDRTYMWVGTPVISIEY